MGIFFVITVLLSFLYEDPGFLISGALLMVSDSISDLAQVIKSKRLECLCRRDEE